MHKFGVGFRGDSGPNAPIVLGTKSFNLSANCCAELDFDEKLDIFQLTLFAELDDVVEAFDVDADGQGNVLFTNRRQQGTGLRFLEQMI